MTTFQKLILNCEFVLFIIIMQEDKIKFIFYIIGTNDNKNIEFKIFLSKSWHFIL